MWSLQMKIQAKNMLTFKNNVHLVKKLGSLLAQIKLNTNILLCLESLIYANKLNTTQVQLHSLSQRCNNSSKPNTCKL